MRVTLTGASGLIGDQAGAGAQARGDDVTVLSRSPASTTPRARRRRPSAWQPTEPAGAGRARSPAATPSSTSPASASTSAGPTRRKRAIARVARGRHAQPRRGAARRRPAARGAVSSSAVGYYGPRGDEIVDEATPPGTDFLAGVCAAWEHQAAARAEELGMRVVRVRTGVVLDGRAARSRGC